MQRVTLQLPQLVPGLRLGLLLGVLNAQMRIEVLAADWCVVPGRNIEVAQERMGKGVTRSSFVLIAPGQLVH